MLSIKTYCSPSNPQGSCKPTTGICKPMDASTLAIYRDLQTQVNRVLHAMGKKTIGVDGRIGSGTVSAVNTALGTGFQKCDQVAILADTILGQAKAKANNMGAPASVPAPRPKSPPSQLGPGGSVMHPDLGGEGFIEFLKSPQGIAIGAATVLGLYLVSRTGKRKKKSSTPLIPAGI